MSADLPLAFFNSTFGWVVVFFLALILFGSRLPKVARNLGKGINEFKKGLNEGSAGSSASDDEDDDADDERPAKRAATPSGSRGSKIDETSV